VNVDIRLDKCKASLSVISKLVTCVHISVVNQLKLPGENGNSRANIKLVKGKTSAFHAFKENFLGFHVELKQLNKRCKYTDI
jgi:hypothetical protein